MVLLVVSPALAAAETVDAGKQFIKSIDRMMVSLSKESRHASATISKAYRDHMDLLVLDEYDAIEHALANGGLVPLPADPLRFNFKPRVEGRFPIGEKDLDNQTSYISARAATIGALIDIASRVKSGPLEITSLVRHSEYQSTLRRTNSNAHTSVPMHTMGLAVDIALINTPLETVYEIRDVLRRMQAAGDILVIGERKQLVFHVVPHPSRLGHFSDVYARALAGSMPGANVIAAASPVLDNLARMVPGVVTEVIALRPTDDFLEEWWAADGAQSDLAVAVSPNVPFTAPPTEPTSLMGRVTSGIASLFGGLLQAVRGVFS
jgi:hypothetical protein